MQGAIVTEYDAAKWLLDTVRMGRKLASNTGAASFFLSQERELEVVVAELTPPEPPAASCSPVSGSSQPEAQDAPAKAA